VKDGENFTFGRGGQKNRLIPDWDNTSGKEEKIFTRKKTWEKKKNVTKEAKET